MIISSNAAMNWSGGDLSGGSLTVAQGGTFTISNANNGITFGYNGGNYVAVTNGGFLTNYGTVIEAGTISGYGGSVIYNAGLWQAVSQCEWANNYGTNTFINAGTLRQTDMAKLTVNWGFSNSGAVVAAFDSVIRFNGAYSDTSAANLSVALGGSNPNLESGMIQFANPLLSSALSQLSRKPDFRRRVIFSK